MIKIRSKCGKYIDLEPNREMTKKHIGDNEFIYSYDKEIFAVGSDQYNFIESIEETVVNCRKVKEILKDYEKVYNKYLEEIDMISVFATKFAVLMELVLDEDSKQEYILLKGSNTRIAYSEKHKHVPPLICFNFSLQESHWRQSLFIYLIKNKISLPFVTINISDFVIDDKTFISSNFPQDSWEYNLCSKYSQSILVQMTFGRIVKKFWKKRSIENIAKEVKIRAIKIADNLYRCTFVCNICVFANAVGRTREDAITGAEKQFIKAMSDIDNMRLLAYMHYLFVRGRASPKKVNPAAKN